MADRQKVAQLIKRLARSVKVQAEYLAKETDYWEGGGDPMESHFEMLDEADAVVKELTEI